MNHARKNKKSKTGGTTALQRITPEREAEKQTETGIEKWPREGKEVTVHDTRPVFKVGFRCYMCDRKKAYEVITKSGEAPTTEELNAKAVSMGWKAGRAVVSRDGPTGGEHSALCPRCNKDTAMTHWGGPRRVRPDTKKGSIKDASMERRKLQ